MKIKNLMDLTLNQINELLCGKKVMVFEYNTGTKVCLIPTTSDQYTNILHYMLHHKVIYKTKGLHLVDVLFNKNLEEILQKVSNTPLQKDKTYYGYYYGESHFGVMIFIFEWQRYKNLMVLCGIVGGLNVYANI